MKTMLLGAALLLTTGAALAQQGQEKTYTFGISDPAKPIMLEVELRHGRLTVQGGDVDNVEVIARPRLLNDEELANVKQNQHWKQQHNSNKPPRSREGLTPVRNAMINMEIEQDGNNIEISSEQSTYYVDLVVNVPRRTNVEAEMYRGGGVMVSDTIGYLELETWRGDVIAERVSGPIVAETHQSAIVVSFAEFSDASPSSLATHSGDIDITVAPKMSAKINVQNYQGEILSGLDVPFNPTEKVERREGTDRQEIVIGGQLTATLDKGGQDLTLITYNGDVYVRKP